MKRGVNAAAAGAPLEFENGEADLGSGAPMGKSNKSGISFRGQMSPVEKEHIRRLVEEPRFVESLGIIVQELELLYPDVLAQEPSDADRAGGGPAPAADAQGAARARPPREMLRAILENWMKDFARLCCETWEVEKVNVTAVAAREHIARLEQEKMHAHRTYMRELSAMRDQISILKRRDPVEFTMCADDIYFYEPTAYFEHSIKEFVKEIVVYKVKQTLSNTCDEMVESGGQVPEAPIYQTIKEKNNEITLLKEKVRDMEYEIERIEVLEDQPKKERPQRPLRRANTVTHLLPPSTSGAGGGGNGGGLGKLCRQCGRAVDGPAGDEADPSDSPKSKSSARRGSHRGAHRQSEDEDNDGGRRGRRSRHHEGEDRDRFRRSIDEDDGRGRRQLSDPDDDSDSSERGVSRTNSRAISRMASRSNSKMPVSRERSMNNGARLSPKASFDDRPPWFAGGVARLPSEVKLMLTDLAEARGQLRGLRESFLQAGAGSAKELEQRIRGQERRIRDLQARLEGAVGEDFLADFPEMADCGVQTAPSAAPTAPSRAGGLSPHPSASGALPAPGLLKPPGAGEASDRKGSRSPRMSISRENSPQDHRGSISLGAGSGGGGGSGSTSQAAVRSSPRRGSARTAQDDGGGHEPPARASALAAHDKWSEGGSGAPSRRSSARSAQEDPSGQSSRRSSANGARDPSDEVPADGHPQRRSSGDGAHDPSGEVPADGHPQRRSSGDGAHDPSGEVSQGQSSRRSSGMGVSDIQGEDGGGDSGGQSPRRSSGFSVHDSQGEADVSSTPSAPRCMPQQRGSGMPPPEASSSSTDRPPSPRVSAPRRQSEEREEVLVAMEAAIQVSEELMQLHGRLLAAIGSNSAAMQVATSLGQRMGSLVERLRAVRHGLGAAPSASRQSAAAACTEDSAGQTERVKALQHELYEIQEKFTEAEFAISELRFKLKDMQQKLQDAGLGDVAEKIMNDVGLRELARAPAMPKEAVFARLYKDAVNRIKRIGRPSSERRARVHAHSMTRGLRQMREPLRRARRQQNPQQLGEDEEDDELDDVLDWPLVCPRCHCSLDQALDDGASQTHATSGEAHGREQPSMSPAAGHQVFGFGVSAASTAVGIELGGEVVSKQTSRPGTGTTTGRRRSTKQATLSHQDASAWMSALSAPVGDWAGLSPSSHSGQSRNGSGALAPSSGLAATPLSQSRSHAASSTSPFQSPQRSRTRDAAWLHSGFSMMELRPSPERERSAPDGLATRGGLVPVRSPQESGSGDHRHPTSTPVIRPKRSGHRSVSSRVRQASPQGSEATSPPEQTPQSRPFGGLRKLLPVVDGGASRASPHKGGGGEAQRPTTSAEGGQAVANLRHTASAPSIAGSPSASSGSLRGHDEELLPRLQRTPSGASLTDQGSAIPSWTKAGVATLLHDAHQGWPMMEDIGLSRMNGGSQPRSKLLVGSPGF